MATIEQAGGEAFPVQAEFGTDGDVGTLLTGLTAGLRGRPLDILVNNAACGNLETVWSAGSVDQLTPERFDEVFAINVKAPLFLVQATLPLMPDGGRIVNISSLATRIALPSQIAYAMTKGALEVMSRTLANALGGRGITVNTVRPGSTDTEVNDTLRSPELRAVLTDLTALGRIGRPPTSPTRSPSSPRTTLAGSPATCSTRPAARTSAPCGHADLPPVGCGQPLAIHRTPFGATPLTGHCRS